MKYSILCPLLFLLPAANRPLGVTAQGMHPEDNRMIAFLGNWQACPSASQLAQYSHVMIAFAVSYTWHPTKNICSPSCQIATPPICNNGPNQNLINTLHQAGSKVILSFGGAGMGGSWAGDVNDCWLHCFGRETQVVDRLVQIVTQLNLDGVDIDYEYFYANNQNGSGFSKGAEAIKFLTDITTGLRSKLPPGSIVTHTPMDADLVQGSAYFNMLQEISDTLDFLMPQYYNGYTRPARDGFAGTGFGSMSAAQHYRRVVDTMFSGDATRMIFGFCISDCGGTGSNANSQQAATVMREIGQHYYCHGGAFFWVAERDLQGSWSSVVNDAMDEYRGCSGSSQPPTPTRVPTSNLPAAPTREPTRLSGSLCCPPAYSGLRAFDSCRSFYHCQQGIVVGTPIQCPSGLLFDEIRQSCNWANAVVCNGNLCNPSKAPTEVPSKLPVATTAAPTPRPSNPPTKIASPEPTSISTPQPPVKVHTPAIAPTKGPITTSPPTSPARQCCAKGYSGFRAFDNCTKFYQCAFGNVRGPIRSCAKGFLFDESIQNCNWEHAVKKCVVDPCNL